jgi:predicted nucleic acid-binding protein
MVLVDTDVLVDCLRGTPPAKAWLEHASAEVLGIPGVVAMELLIGCRNPEEVDHLQKFLSTFSIVWPDAGEFAQAYELLAEHRLTSGLGIPDCLIAAMSLIRKAGLYTFNLNLKLNTFNSFQGSTSRSRTLGGNCPGRVSCWQMRAERERVNVVQQGLMSLIRIRIKVSNVLYRSYGFAAAFRITGMSHTC